MGLAQRYTYKCANLFHLQARPVSSVSTSGLEKAFLDYEGYDGSWVMGLDCVEIVCVISSFPSGCWPEELIDLCQRCRP